MIIVGTHLDKIPVQKTHENREFYRKKIRELYDKPGYPRISAIMCVSCTSGEGIKELQDRIHSAAVKAVDPDTKDHVIGQLVSMYMYSLIFSPISTLALSLAQSVFIASSYYKGGGG